MKVFWALLLLLIAVSIGYLVLGSGQPRRMPTDSGTPAASTTAASTPTPPRVPGQKDNNESAFFDRTDQAVAPVVNTPAAATTDTAPAVPQPPPTAAAADDKKTLTPTTEPEEVAAAAEKPVEPETTAETTKAAATPDKTPAPGDLPSAPAPAIATTPAPATTTSSTPASTAVFDGEASVVKNTDGTMVVDGKYPIKGDGTKANPYQVTWEYLVSAQEDYQPRLGKKKLPGRLKMLAGAYVKITGFVAFPIISTEPTEMLAMLNQWDGCCIGIPPTPYDAIEVKLAEAASDEQRMVTYGSVQGKLVVEPYLVRDWLVSLYAMEDAKLERAQ